MGKLSTLCFASVCGFRPSKTNNGISITPWLTGLGTQNCFISAAFIGLAASSVFLVMIKYGKQFRVRSADKYFAIVAKDH
jgi:hypothetical protein